MLAGLLGPRQSQSLSNAPCRSVLYLAEEWHFWSEQKREGRGNVLHLKNIPGTARGEGQIIRYLAVSGQEGSSASDLSCVHLDSLQMEKWSLVELEEW